MVCGVVLHFSVVVYCACGLVCCHVVCYTLQQFAFNLPQHNLRLIFAPVPVLMANVGRC